MATKSTQKLLTKEGFSLLKTKLQKLETELIDVSRGKMEAAETGGNLWHDNPAYEEVEAKQRSLMYEISQIKSALANANVVDIKKRMSSVTVGSTTKLQLEGGKIMTVTIGDPMTADPQHGVISYESPVGKAIFGAKIGEKRTYGAGGKNVEVTIMSIE